MRFGLNNKQWDRLIQYSDKISAMPATISEFLSYFSDKECGRLNLIYDPEKKVWAVWYDDSLEKFEDKELINAMFELFFNIEEVQ